MVGFHEGLDIGLDRRCPVSWRIYEKHRSFRFTGRIEDVTIDQASGRPTSPHGTYAYRDVLTATAHATHVW